MVRVECIEDLARLPAMAEAWDRLVAASSQPSPMLLSDWWGSWLTTCGSGARPLLLAAWEGERLLGGIALCRQRKHAGPLPVYEEIRFPIGQGVGGLYMDLLVDEAHAQADQVADTLISTLRGTLPWHRLRLERMLPQARLARALREPAGWQGTALELTESVACPVLPLPESMDMLMAGLDPIFRTMLLRKNLKMAARRHAVQFVPQVDSTDLDRDLEHFFAVHTQRWNAEGRGGEFSRPAQRVFYRELARRLDAKGLLRFSKLLLDGEAHSFEFGVQIGGQYFALQAGISLTGLECQAGTAHLYHLYETLLPRASHYHFMEGAESYKYKWGARHQTVQDGQAWCGVRGKALHTLRRLRRALRNGLPWKLRQANSIAATGAGVLGWVGQLSGQLSGQTAGHLPGLVRASEASLQLLDALT
ncbi:GNAT family N-acetyltransferase [Megalodesulfovibrio paquesii]